MVANFPVALASKPFAADDLRGFAHRATTWQQRRRAAAAMSGGLVYNEDSGPRRWPLEQSGSVLADGEPDTL